MKTLVVYYSRTGVTRKVAQAIAGHISADIEEIIDTKDRSGPMGYLIAGKDSAMKVKTPIQPPQKDPAGYDLVIIGTPVWAFTMAAPVRTWMLDFASKCRQVAFFCTEGGSGDERTFRDMEDIAGKAPLEKLVLKDKDVKADLQTAVIEGFAHKLSAIPAGA